MRTAMRDRVCIGQTWRRRRDGYEFRVRQVWRPDRQVLMVNERGITFPVSFNDLRRLWEMVG